MARIPISITTGKIKEENLIVGIDLGTTNSLIAKMEDGKPVALADFGKPTLVPSVVHFRQDGSVVVGDEAKPFLTADPANTIYSAKRLMGKTYRDVDTQTDFFSYRILDDGTDSLVKVAVRDYYYTPIELSSLILKELKSRAEHRLKQEVKQAVITVPAYFNDAQRQATRDAGKLAGLDVLRIVNEPTAAALAYGLGVNPNEQRTVAVYDLGGGTFDVTLLRIEGGVFDVLSTHGDTYLGGDDFDRAIVRHWMQEHALPESTLQDKKAGQQLRLAAEEAKKTLSQAASYQAEVRVSEQTVALSLSRDQFEQLIAPLVQRTLESCRAALEDAALAPSDIEEVILVGGSTRVPAVKSAVAKLFGKTVEALHDQLNPDEVVALGAAVQADILAGNRKDLLLLDVTPLSLGIETAGGLMDVLIPRNNKIPARVGRQYTTARDGQANMRIGVFQGERELVKDNRKLAEFELKGIPSMPAGLAKVEVRFLIDADGILRVEAQELRSGVQAHVEVKPQYGLTDQEVETMLMASLTHAQADVTARMILEARSEAEQMLYYAERFLTKNGHMMSEDEQAGMRNCMEAVRAAIQTGEKDAMHKSLEAMDAYSRPFAERVMDEAVKAAMVGKAVGE